MNRLHFTICKFAPFLFAAISFCGPAQALTIKADGNKTTFRWPDNLQWENAPTLRAYEGTSVVNAEWIEETIPEEWKLNGGSVPPPVYYGELHYAFGYPISRKTSFKVKASNSYGSATITLTQLPSIPSSVSIIGNNEIQCGSYELFKGKATFSGASGTYTFPLTWNVYFGSQLLKTRVAVDCMVDNDITIPYAGKTLRVEASSSGVTTTKYVKIGPAYSLSVTGPSSLERGDSAEFYAKGRATSYSDSVYVDAVWSIESGSQFATIDSETGELTTTAGFESGTVVVKAEWGGRIARKTVKITAPAIEEIVLGTGGEDDFSELSEIASNSETSFRIRGYTKGRGYSSWVDAQCTVVEGAAWCSIESGRLRTVSTDVGRRVVISIVYIRIRITVVLWIRPRVPVSIAISGPSELEAGEIGHYVATTTFSDGTKNVVDVSWVATEPHRTVGPIVAPTLTIGAPSRKEDSSASLVASRDGISSPPFLVTFKGKKIDHLEIIGPGAIPSLGQGQYRCICKFTDGTSEDITDSASWSVEQEAPPVAEFIGKGLLKAASTSRDRTVLVRAESGDKFAEKNVTIYRKTVKSLEIFGPDSVEAGNSAQYTCTVTYSDGTSETVSPQWWLESALSGDSISSGVLRTANSNGKRILLVCAEYDGAQTKKSVLVDGDDDGDEDEETLSYFCIHAKDLSIGAFGHTRFIAQACFHTPRRRYWKDVSDQTTFEPTLPGIYDQYADVNKLTGCVKAHNYTHYEHLVFVKGTYHYNGKKTPNARTKATGVVFIQPRIIPLAPQTPPPSASLSELVVVGPSTVPSGESAEYKCLGRYSDGTMVEINPSWSLVGSMEDRITSNGLFLAGKAIHDRYARIRASFEGKTVDKCITVLGRRIASISISGQDSVPAGESAVYVCTGIFSDGTEDVVSAEWSIVSGWRNASISEDGILRAAEVSTNGTATIQASFGGLSATKTVSIRVAEVGLTPALVSVPIYRFYSKNYKGHFFTIDEDEKDNLINTNPNWHYEGIAFYAFGEKGEGMATLYRFYSKAYKGHFFTIDEDEKNTLIRTNPNWKYEGEAYYVYPEETEGTVPVFRFWSKRYRHHFYTTDEAEKENLIATNPNWKYEGVAFWALEGEMVALAASTVECLSISGPSGVRSGGTGLFTCSAIFADGSAREVEPAWSIAAGGYASISAGGMLSAQSVKTDRTVTVRAVWRGVAAERVVVIEAEEATPTELAVIGPSDVEAGETAQYTCYALFSDGTSQTVDPEWRIISEPPLGTISSNGVFAASATTAGGEVEIEAEWGGMTASRTLWVEAGGDLASIAISGPDAVIAGASARFSCLATWPDGSSDTVMPEWSIADGAEFGTISSNGIFTAAILQRIVTLQAVYAGRTATKTTRVVFPDNLHVGNLYVDAEMGKDANDGKSWSMAKRSIQAAIDAAAAGDLILVNDGRYEPISSNDKQIEIRSVNGAEKTIIDASLQWSRGVTNRCATLGSWNAPTNTILVGFCLTNGIASDGGGSYYGTLNNCTLSGNTASSGGGSCCGTLNNCTLSGNTARSGGGSYYGTLNNCVLSGNGAEYGGGSYYGTLNNCVLSGNSASDGGGSYCGTLHNCTLSGNGAEYGGGSYEGTLNNCIVWGNSANVGNDTSGAFGIHTCSGDHLPGVGNICVNPEFADAARGNFRLIPRSPCIDAGWDPWTGDQDIDLDGNPRLQGSLIDMGAYESHGTLNIPETRPPKTWYVNAATGDDANDGENPASALKSLQAAVEKARNGDTILVANGTYQPIATMDLRILIESAEGAAVTMIDGGGKTRCATLGSSESHTNTVLSGFSLLNGVAKYGGGSYCGTLNNCNLSGNTASFGGGSYYGTLINCTLSGNTAKYGGGSRYGTLNNCIVWGNTARTSNAVYRSTCRYSCLDQAVSGPDNIVVDPLFVDAANGDYRLQLGSPCINAGSNDYSVGDTDLVGNPRIVGGTVDMGAYEYQGARSVVAPESRLLLPTLFSTPLPADDLGCVQTEAESSPGKRAATGETPVPPFAPWSLTSQPDGAAVTIPGETDLGDVFVETRGDSPEFADLWPCTETIPGNADFQSAESSRAVSAEEVLLRLALPDGLFDAQLWSCSEGLLLDEPVEGAFDFDLPANGVWHWLRIRDAADEDAFSVWLRAE